MPKTTFNEILAETQGQLQSYKQRGSSMPSMPNLTLDSLNLAEREIWSRVKDYFNTTPPNMKEHAAEFDPNCEACQALYGNSIDAALTTIQKYLNGTLTDPIEVLNLQYYHDKNNETVNCKVGLVGNKPRVLYTVHRFQYALDEHLKLKNTTVTNISTFTPPKSLDGYVLTGDQQIHVMFKEEL